jgi:hypothetical protein
MRPPFFTPGAERKAKGWDNEGGFLATVNEGFRYIRATPSVFSLVLLVGAVGTFGLNFTVWMPVMARDILLVGADGYGLMMSTMGAGSLISGLALAYGAKQARRRASPRPPLAGPNSARASAHSAIAIIASFSSGN